MTTLFIYCFINILLLCQMYPILKSRHDKSLLADMGTYIAQHTAPNAKIIAIDLGLFIEYYGHRSILIRPANSWHIDPAELKRFQKTLDKLLAEGTPVYIAESSLVTYNPDFIFSNMIKTHYDLKLIGRFPVEDWHHGDLSLYIDMDTLYKLMPQKIRHN